MALFSCLLMLLGNPARVLAQGSHEGPAITVHRTADCGCCTAWEDHLKASGFAVTDVVSDNLAELKTSHGITEELESCHTALVEGYVIEGHVPASAVQRLLKERPAINGLSAPGMPMGSPGMDEDGITPEPYVVVAIHGNGTTSVFERHGF